MAIKRPDFAGTITDLSKKRFVELLYCSYNLLPCQSSLTRAWMNPIIADGPRRYS